jgi:hypothetical protein
VDIVYSTSVGQEDQITVDILSTDAAATWYGKGMRNVTGKGTVTIPVKIYAVGGLTKGTQYLLRAWTVQSSKASDPSPWSYELDRQDALVFAGDSDGSSSSSVTSESSTGEPKMTTGGNEGTSGFKASSGSSLTIGVLLVTMSLLLVL